MTKPPEFSTSRFHTLRRLTRVTALTAACCLGVSVLQAADPDTAATARLEISTTNLNVGALQTAGGFAITVDNRMIVGASPRAATSTALSLWEIGPDQTHRLSDAGGQLPAWAAVAATEDGLCVAGGWSGTGAVANVVRLKLRDDIVTTTPLPPLPVPLTGAGAAVISGKLHVFGGMTSREPVTLSTSLWILDLANPGAGWREDRSFPGTGRAYAAATTQYGMLCLFGGITVTNGTVHSVREAWAFRPVPLEGTMHAGWKRLADIPSGIPLPAVALPLGQAQVLLVGGGERTLPTGSLDEGNVEARPLMYHTITDAWCLFDKELPLRKDPLACRSGNAITVIGSPAGDQATTAATLTLPRTVRNLTWLDYAVIIGYFSLLAGIGFWFSRKQESSAEFSLGNRKVRWWAAGISMFATGASAISFMAIPALAFATNLIWTAPLLMLVPAYFVMAHLVYPLLRRMEITSTYEYLERRFNVPLRLIASAQCIVFQTFGRSSVVLVLPALAISSVTGMNIFHAVILMGVLTTIYTALGGFEAVIWTEVFQGFLKFVAPIMMIGVCIASLRGGFGEFVSMGLEHHKFDLALPTWEVTVPALWILFLAKFFEFTVTQAGDQPIIQRIFSSPLPEVRRVTAMNVTCGIIIGVVTNVLGIAIFAYFKTHPAKFDPLAQNDQIVALFVTQAMPAGAAGVVIAAIFASAMATVASSMNSVATIFTEDFYRRFRPQADDRRRLRVLKTSSYVVGFVGTLSALLLAGLNLKSMMSVWIQIGALLGGGIVGVYTLGMFTKRANSFGAIGGAIISIAATLGVKLFTPLHWALYPPVAIVSCIVSGYLLSLLRPAPTGLAGLTVFTPKPAAAPAVS